MRENEFGFCHVRKNVAGKNTDALSGLMSLDGNNVNLIAGMLGCNLGCWFCFADGLSKGDQNPSSFERFDPSVVVLEASKTPSRTLQFGGGEPSLHLEWVIQACYAAKAHQVRTNMLTNGYVQPWVASALARVLDGCTVGVKGCASPEVYSRLGVDPGPVLESLRIFYHHMVSGGVIGNIVGPGLPGCVENAETFGRWIRDNLSPNARVGIAPECQVGLSRYVLASPAEKTLEMAREVEKRLRGVGLLNVDVIDLSEWNNMLDLHPNQSDDRERVEGAWHEQNQGDHGNHDLIRYQSAS